MKTILTIQPTPPAGLDIDPVCEMSCNSSEVSI